MKTIMLYGFLGEQFGRVHQYDVASPLEAVRALSATLKGFKQALVDGGYYRVSVAGKGSLDIEETAFPCSSRETIRVVPIVAGSGGIFKVVLGATLIAFSGGLFAPALGSVGLFGTTLGSLAGSFGVSLVLGGISQLLFSPPSAPSSREDAKNRPSFAFNGAVNTTRQGGAVPVCFGRVIVGSQVISAGLSSNSGPSQTGGGGKGGGF